MNKWNPEWDRKLTHPPFTQRKFTQAMMQNVENQLHNSNRVHSGGGLLRVAVAVLVLTAFLVTPGIWGAHPQLHDPNPTIDGTKEAAASALMPGDGGGINEWESMETNLLSISDRTLQQFVQALIQRKLGIMGGSYPESDRLWERPGDKKVLGRYDISSPWVAEVYVREIHDDGGATAYRLDLLLTDSTQSEFEETITLSISKLTHQISHVEIVEEEDSFNEAAGLEKVLVQDEENGVIITGMEAGNEGLMRNIQVQYGDRSRIFHEWVNSANESYYPVIWISDLDGDAVDELIVMLTTGHGTGIRAAEVKVLDSNLIEVAAADPVGKAKELLATTVSLEEAERTYHFQLDDDVRTFTYKESDAGAWGDTAGVGSIVEYRVEAHTLYANVSVQVSPGIFPISIELRYVYDEEKLVVGKASFVEVI